ncbi:MAG: DNA alkylation repair protein [Candidatus Merdivicinus sp.]
MIRENYRKRILSMAEPSYRQFSSSLLPGIEGIQGVRLPLLRKMAAEMVRHGEWEEWLSVYFDASDNWFEEDMLAGFCIAGIKIEISERIEQIRMFLPHIGNWSVCDSFCASMKTTARERENYWPFLMECLQDKAEFTVRVGLILLLDHYCVPDWFDRAVSAICAVQHPGYYVQMGQAWALSMFYFIGRERVRRILQEKILPESVCRLTVRKICESRKSSPEERIELRRVLRDKEDE